MIDASTRISDIFESPSEEFEHSDLRAVANASLSDLFFYDSDELYHHGVKGMKWYQHLFGKDKSGSSSKSKKQKGPKDPTKMTNEELKTESDRLRAEKAYLDAYNNRYPKKKSMGETLMKDVVTPALKKSGAKILSKVIEKSISKALNLNDDSDSKKKEDAKSLKDYLDGKEKDAWDLVDEYNRNQEKEYNARQEQLRSDQKMYREANKRFKSEKKSSNMEPMDAPVYLLTDNSVNLEYGKDWIYK